MHNAATQGGDQLQEVFEASLDFIKPTMDAFAERTDTPSPFTLQSKIWRMQYSEATPERRPAIIAEIIQRAYEMQRRVLHLKLVQEAA